VNRLAKSKTKDIKCYFCGELIETENKLVEKKIPMSTKAGVRNYRRKFHIDCLPKYLDGREDKSLLSEENSEWDAVYQYFRSDILGLGKTTPLDQHTIKRLLGLRLGTYYPQGNNTRILKRGYDFKTILLTLKVIKSKVRPYINSTQFANNKHKTDGIMRFVTGEINDVQKRLDATKKAEKKLHEIKTEQVDYKQQYKKKGDNKKNQNIDALFGGLL
jgi:hypothetical protein